MTLLSYLRPRIYPQCNQIHKSVLRGRCHFSVKILRNAKEVADFRELNSKVVLYFTATWCGPCQYVKPIYEQAAANYKGIVKFGKIDVDENSESAIEFDIAAVPTFVFCSGEDVIGSFTGIGMERLPEMIKALEDWDFT